MLSESPVYPRYNEVFGIATHNSYWINRSDQADYFSSGTQELITDQLLHEHVRALEIDIHSEGAQPGQWKVYHTSDSEDFLGRYLDDYLEYLRNFHYAIPGHDVINIIVELKNTVSTTGVSSTVPTNPQWASDHTIDEFDDTFRRLLGPWLYTPADFLRRSPSANTLTECARTAGWPSIAELRGKFMVNVIGNWSSNARDWVVYATSGIRDRVAFPMQSVSRVATELPSDPDPLERDNWVRVADRGGQYWIRDVDDTLADSASMDPADRRAAFEQSVFWQLESREQEALTRMASFIASGGVIRAHDAFKTSTGDNAGRPESFQAIKDTWEQDWELSHGIQLIMTDYPWHVLNDDAPLGSGIPTDPSRRLRDLTWLNGTPGELPGKFRELGARLYAHTTPPAEIWAYQSVPRPSDQWWEATISTTRNGDTWTANTHSGIVLDDVLLSYPRRAQDHGEGGIRVSSLDGRDVVVVARQKNTQPGASYYQEKVSVYVRAFKDGHQVEDKEFSAARYGPCRRNGDPNSDDVSLICVGSLIGLSVRNYERSSTVTVFSAGAMTSFSAGAMTSNWSGETIFPGASAKQITVGQNADGRLEIFYVGTNDALYQALVRRNHIPGCQRKANHRRAERRWSPGDLLRGHQRRPVPYVAALARCAYPSGHS